MLRTVQELMAKVRAQVAAEGTVDWRYLPVAAGAGVFIGAALVYISNLLGVLVILMVGVGIGYIIRSYVSYRRRLKFYAERKEQ